MLIIEPANPTDPGPRALLEQSHALMQELFTPEENFFLGFDALAAPEVHFVIAREGETLLATGAVVQMEGYCEVKSMYTAASARGRGVASAVLRALEDHARGLNAARMMLETGEALASAIRLYERHGFVRCALFGDYTPNDVSVYMEKTL
ncbi:GNAT family N-acetyltransferase [Pelagivirga sediminicola]|uniref:GNAT family N-acetyltransferase n=1 Tax=Pelagivirga sediminicola TaxID=2170575 RepID=A0A2T7G526_9RHOB|nr:GNAT family N-acetyltransferase [Pelagivirga sediminicola]PVA09519.1 GNAT family N-acetyltransferase [Pelagivirga sediminicola]